jgi:hypothetical protein
MSAFALLEKSASAAPAGYHYQRNTASGLNDPFAGYRPNAGTAAHRAENPRHVGWDAAEIGADVALGWNPFTGVPWFGGKAINDFRNGRWGSGLMNVGLGALSFVPGAGSAGAAAKGGLGLAKIAPKLAGGVNTARGAMQTGHRLGKGMRMGLGIGGGAAAVGGGAAQFMGQGQPGAAPAPAAPSHSYPGGQMPVHEYMARSMVANKPY